MSFNRPWNLLYKNWIGPKEIFNWTVLGNGKRFWVNPTHGGSQCTGLSPTLSWKWPRATLSPSFGPFFERNHSFGVKMVSQNFPKCFKSCPWAWYPARAKEIYTTGKRSYTTGHICKLFHFALSLLNWEIAITPERVARLTWFFGSMPKIKPYFIKKLILTNRFWPPPFKIGGVVNSSTLLRLQLKLTTWQHIIFHK